MVWWSLHSGYLDQPVASLPDPSARFAANVQASGRGGGHDLHFRTLRRAGVTLLGHLLEANGRTVRFAADLGASVAWGDERHRQLLDLFRRFASERGLPIPDVDEPEPFDGEAPEELDVSGFGAVVFAGGFRPDYGRWVRVPGAFDDLGFPLHHDGESTAAPGLYFLGVHFLRTRKSSLLFGVGEDAEIVVRAIASSFGARP
jgi:putative flavoprotein involved in K+ transport